MEKRPYIINGERASLEEYRKTKYEDLRIRVPKGRKSELQAHAKKQGESLNAFANRAMDEQIHRDSSNKIINEEQIATIDEQFAAQPFPISEPKADEIEAIKQAKADGEYYTQAELDQIKEAMGDSTIPEDQIDWDSIGVDAEDSSNIINE